jgi:superfamily II DNA or RNA helicase
MINLYPDQEEFIAEIRALWKDHKRIVAMACTGFGKTRVAAKIIEGCTARGMRVCFLVPRISLIQQTAKSFIDLGLEDITLLWADYDTDYSAKITIASADTYIRREKIDFDLVIVDEMHHRRKQLLQWMTEHPDERYIGLSATPFAGWIGEYYTGLAKSKSMRWMIDNGRLCDYEIYAPSSPDLSGLKTRETAYGQDYVEADIAEIMDGAQVVGNIVGNWLEYGQNRLTMALPVNVAHANHLCIEFQRAGISAEVVSAKTPIEERERIFTRVRSGITRIVLSVNCLTEGFDIPEISCVINARPTKSRARWMQGAGRGLRKKPEGYQFQDCIIFDHSGTAIDLGFPEDISIDQLNTGDNGMKETGDRDPEEKVEKKPKECPQCKFLKAAGVYVCPKCGFKPIVGQDVEVDETRGLVKLKGSKKIEKTKEEKEDFWLQLKGYQRERAAEGKPVSDGYIAHTYKDWGGVWPRSMPNGCKPAGAEVKNFIKHKNIKFAKGKAKNANG